MKRLMYTGAIILGFAQAGLAQNLLVNGDFEASPNPSLGFFSSAEIPPWRSTGLPNGTGQYDISRNPHILIQMDGPGGHNPGPSFPESDASAPGAGVPQHFLTVAPYAWQYVTPSCDGTLTFSVSAARMWNVSYDYTAGNAISIVPVPTQVGYLSHSGYVPTSDTQTVIDLIAAHDVVKSDVILPTGQPLENTWFPFSTQAAVQAGQAYAVVLEANSWDSRLGYDNASAILACAGSVITPQDIALLKSCELEDAHTHNGVLGQRWACQVDVTAQSAPFAGDIILHDLFTDTPLVNGEILLGESVSGNGSCFQGDCQISGTNFDSSGTESFTFDVFVEAVGEADVYPLENCITGEIDDGSGTMQPLTPHCTTGQWIPRSEVVKTCEPIPENATAPYTMNCSIEVTASGLVGGTYVSVMDAFAAQPPNIATVMPTFMNVSSSENWDCIDHALNTPSSIGICELSAEDLMAAGGTSTLDISFQFDVDQAPTQVANCRFTDIHDGSYLAKLSGQRSALRAPIQNGAGQNAGWPQMPDGCVYVDVPGTPLPPKVETKITKDCDQPTLTNLNGIWGYLWQCEAEVDVSPSPFAGDVSFTDDGSQISMGTSEFVSVSDPTNCQGLNTDTLECTYAGASFSSPHIVQYDLFTPYTQTNEEIEWKNCIHGEAVTPAGSFPSVPMCTGRIIKPTDVPVLPPVKDIKLEKLCEDVGREMEHDGQSGFGWDCQINVTATPAPFAGNFTFTEDASAVTGSNGQIIAIDQPQPAHWSCSPNVPVASTDCTIAGANFDASGTETLGFTLFAPNTGEPVAWENCVRGVYIPDEEGDSGGEPREIKGNCESITWKPPVVDPKTPAFDVKKECKPEGERQILGPNAWFQQWSCTLTVTSNGVPFNDPLWLDEDMLYGPHDGSQSVVSVTSNDPWQCTPAPYGTGANQPACAIHGNQFPHSTSTLNVTVNVFGGAADQFGAQNCVSLNLGETPSSSPADVLADDCFEIVAAPEPKEPQINLVKTCEAATQSGTGQWTVECTLTITGQNLPNGEQFRVVDELMSSSTQAATFGSLNAQTNSCGGGPIAGGTMAGCDLTTDMINANGGTLTIPYTGTYQGPAGRPINGPRAQNCAFVDIPNLGLHGPQGGNGKSCVPIEFKASISSGISDIPINPQIPGGGTPDVGGGTEPSAPLEATGSANTIALPPQTPSITKTCDPLVFENPNRPTAARCDIAVSVPEGGQFQVFKLSDFMGVPLSEFNVAQVSGPNLTGLPDLGCVETMGSFGIPAVDCTGIGVNAMSTGGDFDFEWTAQVGTPPTGAEVYQNCAQLVYFEAGSSLPTSIEACHDFEITGHKTADAPSADTDPALQAAPVIEHTLRTRKFLTSDCVADRTTQRYTCGFRITVTNEGNAQFNGPLVVTDTFGNPYAQAITQTSQGGWSCAQPVGLAVSCEHSGLTLPQGSFTYIDLNMEVQGLANGGQFENCAATGIPNERKQRVAAIQQVMNARGLAAGPVDGLPGNKTYAALAELQKSLGLPVSRDFNDALFSALGLPLAKPGEKACVDADLPLMPKPPIQCERATTVKKGENCLCRYDNMVRRNATACQCKGGYAFIAGKGCVKQVTKPRPHSTSPPQLEETLTCDKRSTRLRGDQCICIDQKNAVKTSKTTCGCRNGGLMISGRCLSIKIAPKPTPSKPDNPVGTEEPADAAGKTCQLRLNGICLKWR